MAKVNHRKARPALLQDGYDLLFKKPTTLHALVLKLGQNELQTGLKRGGKVTHARLFARQNSEAENSLKNSIAFSNEPSHLTSSSTSQTDHRAVRGNGKKPSRLGIITFGNVCAFITASAGIMSFR